MISHLATLLGFAFAFAGNTPRSATVRRSMWIAATYGSLLLALILLTEPADQTSWRGAADRADIDGFYYERAQELNENQATWEPYWTYETE